MLNVSLVTVSLSLGLSAVGTASLISTSVGSDAALAVSPLKVPWQTRQDPASVLALVSWHARSSVLSGRSDELAELERWAHSTIPVSIKFLTGPGGIGKSRLAAEFATSLAQRRWSAGFVDLRRPAKFPLKRRGTLLVIDYPERHPRDVRELLRDLATLGDSPRLRILFLSRQPMDHWIETVHDTGCDVLLDGAPIGLGALSVDDSHALYRSALSTAAETYDTTPFGISLDPFRDWFDSLPEHRRALFAVALAVYGALHPEDARVTISGSEVIEALARRELSRLHSCAETGGFSDRCALARLVAVSTIAGGFPVDDLGTLREAGVLGSCSWTGAALRERLNDMALLDNELVVVPTPDIVAASLVTCALAEDPARAPELVWHAIAHDFDRSIPTFSRLSYDAELVLGMRDNRLSSWLASGIRGKANRARAFSGVASETNLAIGLIPSAVAVWRTLLSETTDDAERASLLNNLSADLSEAGERPAALEAIREAVELYRRLAEANPARYEPDLARSLDNLRRIDNG